MNRPTLIALITTLAAAWAAEAKLTPEQMAKLPAPAAVRVDFARDVRPILEAACVKCHGKGKDKGGFSLETGASFLKGGDTGTPVVPAKSAESLLIELVSGLDPDNVMPQKGSKLTAEQVSVLRAWIDQGAEWPAEITFHKAPVLNLHPRQVELPPAAGQAINPIDRLLAPYFAAHTVAAAGPVDDRAFARRVYLDVIGLLPTPKELDEFLADTRADMREQLVAKLLADNPRYAGHWLSFWNDLLRNDYKGAGYIDNGRKQISTWLFSALLTNMPYNQLVAKLVDPTPESEGFINGISWRGAINASQVPPMQAAQSIGQVFLGVNLKCASCHDSFINDYTLADSYGMAAIYAPDPLEVAECDKPTGAISRVKFLYSELGEIDGTLPKPERTKRLAEILTSPQNGRVPRTVVNRLWAKFMGVGLVEPVDEMDLPAWNPDLLDWLAEDFVTHGYDLKRTMDLILTSRAYRRPPVNLGEQREEGYVFAGPAIRRMSAEQFRDALGQLTGVWYAKAAAKFEPSSEGKPPADTDVHGGVRASSVAADPLAVALGRPNREQIATTRASAATTLQGLELTNGETLNTILKRGAEKLLSENKRPPGELVSDVFVKALGRQPTSDELKLSAELVGSPAGQEGMEDLLWGIAMLPEFQLIH